MDVKLTKYRQKICGSRDYELQVYFLIFLIDFIMRNTQVKQLQKFKCQTKKKNTSQCMRCFSLD